MLMTITVSLSVATATLRGAIRTAGFWWKLALWGLVLAIQVLGIVFTVSRGPWFGTILGVVVFLGAVGLFVDWRTLARASLLLVATAVLAVALHAVFSPILTQSESDEASAPLTSEFIQERLTGIGGGGGASGLGNRLEIWKGSWRLMTAHPWFEFDNLSVSSLRLLVGYGPELFHIVYLLESPPIGQFHLPLEMSHAHNYFVHQGVEQGFLGALSSGGVFAALFLVGGYLLFRRRASYTAVHKLVMIGLLAALAGRVLEQMVGIARVSDLTMSWVLLAIFAALPAIMREPQAASEAAPRRDRRRRPSSHLSAPGPQATAYSWQFFGQIVLIGWLVVGIGALTWVKGINQIRAAVIADRAVGELQAGRPQTALSSLEKAIDLAPDVSSYYSDRADVYQIYRRNDQLIPLPECGSQVNIQSIRVCLAEEEYLNAQEWVQKRPLSVKSQFALADSATRLASLKNDTFLRRQSIKAYNKTAEMIPNSYPLWTRLAASYIVSGQPEAALEPLEKALSLLGNSLESAPVLVLQAEAYHNLGWAEQELDSLNEATRRFPTYAEPYYLRGVINQEVDLYEKAIDDFKEAIRLNPEDAQYWYIQGVTYYELGRHEEAIEDLDEAVSLDPRRALAYNTRGIAYAELGQLERAVEDLGLAIGINPGLASAYNNRGSVYRQLGESAKAIDDLDWATKLDPKNASAYYNRALAYTQLGNDAAAQLDVERAEGLGFDPTVLSNAIEEAKKSR